MSTVGDTVVSSSGDLDLEYLSPCTHEEADYRMPLHLAHMVRNNLSKLILRTNDTDVPVICIAHFHEIPGLVELWIAFGTGKSYRVIPVHTIAMHLGPDKSRALLGFHAYTGCDSVSSFYGHSKTAWKLWTHNPKSQKHSCT